MPLNEHTIRAAAVALFGVAEHEVDDLCKKLAAMVQAGGAGGAAAVAGPSQESFDALKSEVEDQTKTIAALQQTIDDLTKPDAPADAGATGTTAGITS